jgi:NTP pyrophosphatase (non-canonical NTP hydrolase)
MELNELRAFQESFDRKHGWVLKSDELPELIDILHKDLVGLMGEVGEFANVLKKVTLVESSSGLSEGENIFKESEDQLAQELTDALVYMLRIATHLKIDMEKEYLKKLENTNLVIN